MAIFVFLKGMVHLKNHITSKCLKDPFISKKQFYAYLMLKRSILHSEGTAPHMIQGLYLSCQILFLCFKYA